MFKKIKVNMCVSMPIHILEVPDTKIANIPLITNFDRISGYN